MTRQPLNPVAGRQRHQKIIINPLLLLQKERGGVLPRLPYQRTQAQAHRLPSLFIQLRASTKKKKINPHAMRLIANIVKLDEEFDKSWRDGAGKRQYLPLAGHIEFECQRQ